MSGTLSPGAEAVWLAFGLAFFLGLRHATDPDHLTALLVLCSDAEPDARGAGRLGLAWGLGHAVTCTALGLVVVGLRPDLPAWLAPAVELAIGALIVGLALRLLVRWRRGNLHAHPHRHGGLRHSHAHAHEPRPGEAHAEVHAHRHAALGRSPRAAFGVGLVHGAGGSAAAAALLVATRADPLASVALLASFAAGTIVSMSAVSAALGAALGSRRLALRFDRVARGVAVASLAFGTWYAAAAFAALGGR